ncbi:MAG: hypothetical protein PHP97_03215 [Candidatus Shapirobacteria bacterium]|nr:hypothetical protein [Candidatus Shapirobacteria bacterium]MDD3002332.1 hypothetical protein [Candidatus Shapirobacteria bacterium]MDD4382663.1 hypothetical protein [Candidatus Shapirobacteria bacterium]
MKEGFKLPDKIFGLEKSLLTLFLPPLVLILIFFISLNFILIPRINEIRNVNKKINEINSKTDKVNEQIKYLNSVDSEELQKNADYLDNAVLKNKEFYLLVGIIRGVASKFNYQIESFSLAPGELKDDEVKSKTSLGNMVKMPINLSLDGPKDKKLELISALERTLPILFIDRFETSTSGDIARLNLTVSSYYIGDEINIDTSNVALSDLILSNEESALLEKISSFTKIEENQSNIGTTEFKQYQRENPFSL